MSRVMSPPAQSVRVLSENLRGRSPVVVLLIAFAVRILFCAVVYPRIAGRLGWLGIDDGFDELAANLLAGHGFAFHPSLPPNLTTPPGYAYFLAAIYRLTGVAMNEGWRIWVAQSLLDTATTALVMVIAFRIFESRRAALWAGTLYALYPQIIVYCARPYGEVLATFLLALAVTVAIEVERNPAALTALIAGVLFGLAALVKEKSLLFPPLLAAFILWRWRRLGARRGAVAALLLLLGTGLAVSPWVARGYQLTGRIIPITSRTGRALHWGLRTDYGAGDPYVSEVRDPRGVHSGEWAMIPPARRSGGGAGNGADSAPNEARERVEGDDALLGSSWRTIRERPGEFLRLLPVKVLAFWYWGQPGVIWVNFATQIPLLVLGVWGVILARDRSRLAVPVLLVVYFALLHAVLVARMRYSLPVMPYVVLLAGAMIAM